MKPRQLTKSRRKLNASACDKKASFQFIWVIGRPGYKNLHYLRQLTGCQNPKYRSIDRHISDRQNPHPLRHNLFFDQIQRAFAKHRVARQKNGTNSNDGRHINHMLLSKPLFDQFTGWRSGNPRTIARDAVGINGASMSHVGQ